MVVVGRTEGAVADLRQVPRHSSEKLFAFRRNEPKTKLMKFPPSVMVYRAVRYGYLSKGRGSDCRRWPVVESSHGGQG